MKVRTIQHDNTACCQGRVSTRKHFLAFAKAESDQLQASGHLGLAANYRCAANSLRRFLNTSGCMDITFDQLTPCVVNSYEEWLRQGGVTRNSSSCYMRSLQAIYNRAVRRGLAEGTPFSNVYTGVAKTRKRAVCISDIRRLYRLNIRHCLLLSDCNPRRKTFEQVCENLEFARDLFIFCFCARGLTFVDLCFLHKADLKGGTISYVRRKTGQQLQVRVEPLMQRIISRWQTRKGPYLFPILTSTNRQKAYLQYRTALRQYNKNLKTISLFMRPGVNLSSYVCRHTWATAAYQQQIPLSVISQAMGHDSELTTKIYLKSLESSVIDKANHTLIESVFYKPAKTPKAFTI